MKTVDLRTRQNIEAQGFTGLSDETLAGINYALRLAPALCLIWTAVGTVYASRAVLWSLLPFAALGAILPGHPFDMFYNRGLRYLFDSPSLPRYQKPRRFACAVASAFLLAAALCFQFGKVVAGYWVGGALVAAAFVNVTTGFCIPSFLYRLMFRGEKAGQAEASCTRNC